MKREDNGHVMVRNASKDTSKVLHVSKDIALKRCLMAKQGVQCTSWMNLQLMTI